MIEPKRTSMTNQVDRDDPPDPELAPPVDRAVYWGRALISMCQSHEQTALLVNAVPWFIAPISQPMRELEAALNDLNDPEGGADGKGTDSEGAGLRGGTCGKDA
jgi:hypothetical protein